MKNSKILNFTKRITCFLTALMLSASLAACGQSEDSPTASSTKKRTAEKNAAETAADMVDGAGDTADTADAAGKSAAPTTERNDVYAAEDAVGEAAEANGVALDAPTNLEPADDFDESVSSYGVLTAGEWRDNDNWGFFTNLVNTGVISFPSFGIDPTNRIALQVKNSEGEPVVNARVNIAKADGTVVWEAVTDKNGAAYLFFVLGNEPAVINIESAGKSASYDVVLDLDNRDEQGNSLVSNSTQEVIFDEGYELYEKTEVMFIVDTTGSMGDELTFLQGEFSHIAKEIGTENVSYSVNFYRDEGDDYVTKCMGFTNDLDEINEILYAESSSGGGDTPEAVAEILQQTMMEGDWSEDSVKLAFLIFDAPPHEEKSSELLEAVMAASKKGIRLVPVVSSNSERETELFGRAISICTGGTYVFLTDDSGIGNSHLEPIIGGYEVEKLYDIIIRIVRENMQID